MRVEGHHRAVDIGNLAQREGPRGIGDDLAFLAPLGRFDHPFADRFDGDDIAGLEHLVGAADRRPALLTLDPGPRPAQLGARYGPLRAVLEADPGAKLVRLQHHRKPPGCERRRRLDLGEAGRPIGAGPGPAGGAFQPRHGAAPAMAAVIGDEPVAQRLIGDRLQLGFQGRAHRQAAAVELRLAIALEKLAPDLLGEVLRTGQQGRGAFVHDNRLGLGRPGLGRADERFLGHARDHPVPPLLCRLGTADGMVVVGGLGQRRDQGRLGDRQFIHGLVEVIERRRRRAIGAEPQIDLVQVKFEDAALAQRPLDA